MTNKEIRSFELIKKLRERSLLKLIERLKKFVHAYKEINDNDKIKSDFQFSWNKWRDGGKNDK